MVHWYRVALSTKRSISSSMKLLLWANFLSDYFCLTFYQNMYLWFFVSSFVDSLSLSDRTWCISHQRELKWLQLCSSSVAFKNRKQNCLEFGWPFNNLLINLVCRPVCCLVDFFVSSFAPGTWCYPPAWTTYVSTKLQLSLLTLPVRMTDHFRQSSMQTVKVFELIYWGNLSLC